MTQAEHIFWTYFKGTEAEKAAWQAAHQTSFVTALGEGHDAQNTASELRVTDPADASLLQVIDDMPSHVWVGTDGEAEVRWFDALVQQYTRQDLNNPVLVRYNRFGKVKHKTWLNGDGTLTERDYNG